jgi:micrococcal nuclease
MSKRTRGIIIVLCLLAVGVLILLDQACISQRSKPVSAGQVGTYDFNRYHNKSFTAAKVVDGDTIDIEAADGDKKYTRIRLWGIDTPETKHPEFGVMYFGPEAAEFATKLAMGRQVTVYLEEHRTRDKYDRLLAYIQLPDGRFLNEVLVSEGFAYADSRFRHSFYHKYKQLEAGARRQKKGLWKEIRREQLPEWLQRKEPNLLKK